MVIFFPGSFDPFTKGHADLVERSLPLCDKLVIAVGYNEQKQGWQSVEERVAAIQRIYKEDNRVEVVIYSDLTVDAAQRVGASYILRGVRTMKDYEYELQMADVNRQLSGIDTLVLFANPTLASVSSSMVRELAHFGRDIAGFLP